MSLSDTINRSIHRSWGQCLSQGVREAVCSQSIRMCLIHSLCQSVTATVCLSALTVSVSRLVGQLLCQSARKSVVSQPVRTSVSQTLTGSVSHCVRQLVGEAAGGSGDRRTAPPLCLEPGPLEAMQTQGENSEALCKGEALLL